MKNPWNATQHCSACGWAGSFTRIVHAPRMKCEGSLDDLISAPAANSSGAFTSVDAPDGATEFSISPSGSSGGLMFFGLFWTAISSVIFVAFAFHGPPWPARVFAALFPLAGVFFIYLALRIKYSRRCLILNADEIILERTLFWSVSRKSLRRDGPVAVGLKEFFTRNYQPVHGIEIRARSGKLRLGSEMELPDKLSLCAELRRRLAAAEPPSASASASGAATQPAPGGGASSQELRSDDRKGKPLEITEEAGRVAVRAAPRGGGSVLIVFALIFLAMDAHFAFKWFRGAEPPDDFFSLLFIIVPALVMTVMALTGIVILLVGVAMSKSVTFVEADAAGLRCELKRRRNSRSVHLLPNEILRLDTVIDSWINRVPDWCGEIVTQDEVFPFGHGASRESLRHAIDALGRVTGRHAAAA